MNKNKFRQKITSENEFDVFVLPLHKRPRLGKRQGSFKEMKVVGLHPRNQYEATPHTVASVVTWSHAYRLTNTKQKRKDQPVTFAHSQHYNL